MILHVQLHVQRLTIKGKGAVLSVAILCVSLGYPDAGVASWCWGYV